MLTVVKILVAGVGNVLRGDDGFGVAAAHRLLSQPLPSELQVIEVGIGGIHLVQELLDSTQALFVLDAVDLGKPPGTVFVVRPDVADVSELSPEQRRDELADMHWATPERAFLLARALGILPDCTWIIGCQPEDASGLGEGLSPRVVDAIEPAIRELRSMVRGLGVPWGSSLGPGDGKPAEQ
jgi:hydrogenase maturation protease